MADQTLTDDRPERRPSASACSGGLYRAAGSVPDARELGEIETRLLDDTTTNRDINRLVATGVLSHPVGELSDGLASPFRDDSAFGIPAFKADDQRI